MAFHNVQFPSDISYGSSGGPGFSTDIVSTTGGHEQRNSNWAEARARYNVAHGVKTPSQLDALIAFFRARRGRAHSFRFKDWSDYSALNQPIGGGDAQQTDFQLVKRYSSGSVSHSRIISLPVSDTVRIYFDGSEQSSGWGVDDTTGIISFDTAPGSNVSISADFEFDVPVRFDTDQLNARLDDFQQRSWRDIPLLEVRV